MTLLNTLHDTLHPMIDIDGVQKHRHNSLGNPIHHTDEGIRNFHKWFGDSKIVDEHGRPKVVYHGSHLNNIDEFKPTESKRSLWGGLAEYDVKSDAHFFTTDRDLAWDFAKNRLDYHKYNGKDSMEKWKTHNASVYPVYLKAKNPIDLTGTPTQSVNKLKKIGVDTDKKFGKDKKPGIDDIYTLFDDNDFTKHLKEKGYDSATMKENIKKGGRSIAVLHPNQIKSVRNLGLFSNESNKLHEETSLLYSLNESLHPMINVDGIQKHRNNSLGYPIHHTDEGIKNFHKWFGDSKIVDKHGRPKVVYHGTGHDFDEFDDEKTGTSNDAGFAGKGHYFMDDPEWASGYAEVSNLPHKNVKPVYLKMNNPLETHDYADIMRFTGISHTSKVPDKHEAEHITNVLNQHRYDGTVVYQKDWGGTTEYKVHHPSQIKSIYNKGGFSDKTNKIVEETNFSRAHEIARINAALPISQGGLGLHPENTAKDRARALGYNVDKPMYRGLSKEHSDDVVRHITWTSPDAEHASNYVIKDNDYEAPNMMKVYIKSNHPVHLGFRFHNTTTNFKDMKSRIKDKIIDAFEKGHTDRATAYNEFKKIDGIEDIPGTKYHWEWREEHPEFTQALKNVGYDSYHDQEGIQGQHTTVGLFHPSQVKSVNAAFDPMKIRGGIMENNFMEHLVLEDYDSDLPHDYFKDTDNGYSDSKIQRFNSIKGHIIPKDKSVRHYTSNGFDKINSNLWKYKFGNELSDEIKINTHHIQSAIKNTLPANEEHSLYSGIRHFNGDIIHIPSFMSTSLSPEIANDFARINHEHNPTAAYHVLKIQSRKGQHLGNVIENAKLQDEHEVLLPANQVLKIHSTHTYKDSFDYPIHVHTATIMTPEEIEAHKNHPEVKSHLRMKKELNI